MPPHFPNWASFETYLDDLGFFRMELGLERIGSVLDRLGLLRLPCPAVQVVGTNGKGSTSTFLASIAAAHGLKVGLYTSPHFIDVRERLRVFHRQEQPGERKQARCIDDRSIQADCQTGGKGEAFSAGRRGHPELDQAGPDGNAVILPHGQITGACEPDKGAPASAFGDLLPEERWLEAANTVLANGGEVLTYFELVTVIAAWLLSEEKIDLAVLESGLGGAHDAVSALESDLTLFTPIALDHCSVLGDTLEDIARDKAGAMHQGRLAVSARQDPAAERILREVAAARGVELIFTDSTLFPEPFHHGSGLGIPGEHQAGNAALALTAWNRLRAMLERPANPALDAQGLAGARIPGRMQFIQPAPNLDLPHPALIVDGGHNAHGLAALGKSLARLGIAPAAVIFNCMSDKEPEKLIPHLRVLSTGPIFVPEIPDNPRAMPAAETASLIGLAATPVRDIAEAIRLATLEMNDRLPEEFLPERVLPKRTLPERVLPKRTLQDQRNQDIHECKHPLLICGSLYLLGEFYALYPQYLTKDSA